MWMQDRCKVHMDSYMASDGSYFKVTWPTFKNHLLEVGITQNRTTLTPDAQQHRWFILLYHVQKPTWIEIYRNSIWLRARSHMASHYTWGSVTTLHDLRGGLGRPLDTFFRAPTMSWSRLLACVRSGPKGHFTHAIDNPRPLHFKHSYWRKWRSQYKSASHYAWGTNIVCGCKMDVKSIWILTWHRMEHVSWSLGLFSKTTSWR